MTETTNELLLVEGITGHLHSPHRSHRFVHAEKLLLRHLDLQGRAVSPVRAERVFMQLDRERLRVVGIIRESCCVCRRLQRPQADGLDGRESTHSASERVTWRRSGLHTSLRGRRGRNLASEAITGGTVRRVVVVVVGDEDVECVAPWRWHDSRSPQR